MKKLITLVITTIIAISTNAMTWANEDRAVQFEERLEVTKARLNLSDEQIEQITPILEASFEERRQALAKHGINLESRDGAIQNMSFREKRKLGKDMKAIRKSTFKEMSTVLTDEQLAEFKEIQEENRAALRAKLKERKG